MARKLMELFARFRRAEDAVLEARFCALGQTPSSHRHRRMHRPVSPFKFVARTA